MILEFEIPGLPKTTNAMNIHWRLRHTEIKKWKRLVAEQVTLLWPKTNEPLVSAALRLTRFSTREPDFDGLVSSFKAVVDGLVEAGVIVNDKVSVIGQPVYLWQYARPRQGKISVKVEAA